MISNAWQSFGGAAPTSKPPLFEYTEAQILAKAEKFIPADMVADFMGYVMHGEECGDFLEAVFKNDLMGALVTSDADNRGRLWDYCMLLYNYTPTGCYGSEQNQREWIEIGGLKGIQRRIEEQAAAANLHYKENSVDV